MKNFKVGLQLYSIRDDVQKDMDAALKQVKEMGYDYVELAGFYDYTADEVRALLDKHGLTAISAHQGAQPYLEQGQKVIDDLVKVGVKYVAIPWCEVERHKGTDEWDNTVKSFTQFGQALKDAGIQLLYHNHDFEFNKFEGKYLLDWLYETIPEELLQPEIDTCWVRYAGVDPCDYIEKYSGRLDVLHLKDFVGEKTGGSVYALIDDKGGTKEEETKSENSGFAMKSLGNGVQDFPAILEAAEKAGIEYIIVEQDNSDDRPMMEEVRISREYLRSLGL